MYKKLKIGVVSAAYNEERFIKEVIETMPPFVDRIYVVNDSSNDGTARVVEGLSDRRTELITHNSRQGPGAATLTGYKRALEDGMEIVAVMAGDGQMDPAILHKIVEPVAAGRADYAKGNRLSDQKSRNGMPRFRLIGNSMLNSMVKVASGYWRVGDPMNGYTAISRRSLAMIDLDRIERGYAFETDLLVKLNVSGARVVNIPMQSRYRGEKSKIVYFTFVGRMLVVLSKSFAWRMWAKYLHQSRANPSPPAYVTATSPGRQQKLKATYASVSACRHVNPKE